MFLVARWCHMKGLFIVFLVVVAYGGIAGVMAAMGGRDPLSLLPIR